MTLGQWLGQWQGDWDGSLEPQAPGALSGTASISIAAAGTPTAIASIAGTAGIGLSGAGTLGAESGEPIISTIAGTATLSVTAYGSFLSELELPPAPALSGFRSSGGGNGYVWKDNSWVRADKVVHCEVGTPDDATPVAHAQATARTAYLTLMSSQPQVQTSASARGTLRLCSIETPKSTQNSYNKAESSTGITTISGYNGTCETIGIDEILMALELAA